MRKAAVAALVLVPVAIVCLCLYERSGSVCPGLQTVVVPEALQTGDWGETVGGLRARLHLSGVRTVGGKVKRLFMSFAIEVQNVADRERTVVFEYLPNELGLSPDRPDPTEVMFMPRRSNWLGGSDGAAGSDVAVPVIAPGRSAYRTHEVAFFPQRDHGAAATSRGAEFGGVIRNDDDPALTLRTGVLVLERDATDWLTGDRPDSGPQ